MLYTLLAVAIVALVIWIGWKLFQVAHRKAGEDSEQREDWPWSNPS